MAHACSSRSVGRSRFARLIRRSVYFPVLLAATAGAAAWEVHPGHRVQKLPVPAPGQAGFTRLNPADLQINFRNALADEELAKKSNLMNGSGVALGDFDSDGRCDIFFASLKTGCRLYRNLGGWKFQDVTEAAGVAGAGRISRGAAFADVNGDDRLDLLVTTTGGGTFCFLNNGPGGFTETKLPSGLLTNPGSTSLALSDLRGSGQLDLYVANFAETSILRDGVNISTRLVNGRPVVTGRYANRLQIIDGEMIEFGEPDTLYRNDGRGNFTPVPWGESSFLDARGAPARAPWDFGLAVQLRDLNGDGAPDIYVCNDYDTPDRMWLNDGRGNFRAAPPLALRHLSGASMGVDVADIDRDGRADIFVVEMRSRRHRDRIRQGSSVKLTAGRPGEIDNQPQVARNTLYWNRGDGTYAEIADFAGLSATDWSWQPVFLDVDLDGFEDVLVANGVARDMNHLDFALATGRAHAATNWMTTMPPFQTPNVAFRNRGDLTFAETGAAWGFDALEISEGIAPADLDGDGDLDVIVNCLNAPPLIYRNNSSAPRVAVRLRGRAPNTRGIGAQIIVRGGAVPRQSAEMIAGGYFHSGAEAMRVFAAGSLTNQLAIEVIWRNGTRSVVSNAQANCLYEIDEAAAGPKPPDKSPDPAPFFRDVSAQLNHTHHEELFDDFARQPLLPKRLSQLGPGVAWFDLDGDGRDELIVGSGRGGALAVYRHDGKGTFQPWLDNNWAAPAPRDQTGLAGWTPRPGERALLVGLANYEDDSTNGWSVQMFVPGAKAPVGLPDVPASTGPLAVADYDGDGALDLFGGGRVVRGRWPEAASSHLYRNVNGRLELDAENSARLKNVGLVSGAVWSDLDGDGRPELILACEWGPVRVFKNDAGRLREITRELGLAEFTGWWSGVTTGDLDGDGRPDIIAGNWGLNSPYEAGPQQPARVFFGEFNPAKRLDVLETEFDPTLQKIVPLRTLTAVGAALPFVRGTLPTHQAYSEAGLAEILGGHFPRARETQARTLASTVFLNRGGRFEATPLPREAQFAPVFGVSVADFDGDGHEDVFLSQNFFATHAELPRLDAGRGLWLRGDGSGRLTPVPGQESGVAVYGEQRGCALADYDGDGRVDLAVAQNGAATRLFHNERAKPGVRVRLAGPPGNPDGFGASVRLGFGARLGPAREIHAGGGHWSQDSALPVLAAPAPPDRVVVRWPGEKTTTQEIPPATSEVIVRHQP